MESVRKSTRFPVRIGQTLGLWEILGLYFGHRAPKIQANTGSTEGEIHAYFGAQSTRRLVMHYIVKIESVHVFFPVFLRFDPVFPTTLTCAPLSAAAAVAVASPTWAYWSSSHLRLEPLGAGGLVRRPPFRWFSWLPAATGCRCCSGLNCLTPMQVRGFLPFGTFRAVVFLGAGLCERVGLSSTRSMCAPYLALEVRSPGVGGHRHLCLCTIPLR